jgi:NADPH2:quinone reductase
MRGFVVSEYLHPSKISVSSGVPEPEAGGGQVLVDVYSAGLNFFDVGTPARAPFQSIPFTFSLQILQTQGRYQIKPPLPFVLGTEFAGRISKDSPIPKGCPFKHGDRVFGAGQGTYADKVAVMHTQVRPLPDAMSYNQGAGVCFCEFDY